jgi:hypothetical protein
MTTESEEQLGQSRLYKVTDLSILYESSLGACCSNGITIGDNQRCYRRKLL